MAVSRIDNLHVIISPGLHISCNVWLPQNLNFIGNTPEKRITEFSPEDKADLVFEYVPYRKDDLIFQRDHSRHSFFAQHGFVSIRADMRGTGDSGGTPDPSKDAADAAAVLEYFKNYDWASGKVYLFGLSWGGSVALEVAAKYAGLVHGCVVSCSNGDRETAINFTQGCVIASELVPFSNMMFARNALPMKRNFSKAAWLERLRAMTPQIVYERLEQQNTTPMRPYFDTSNAKAAKCPILMITGFRDYAKNGVFDLSADGRLNRASRVILGPWAHNFPDVALPTLNFDLMGASLLWFRQDGKVVSLPRLSVYCENNGQWYSATERSVNRVPIDIGAAPLVLKDAHPFQALWGGSWFTKGVHDDPGDQTVANQHCDSWIVDVTEGTIICGVPKVTVSFKGAPDRFYLAATLCVKESESSTKQISAGMKYITTADSVTFELGALCFRKSEFPLIFTLKTNYFPIIPTMQLGKKVTVTGIDLSIPQLSKYTAGSPFFDRPSSQLPVVQSTIIKKPGFSRVVKIHLGGSLPDTVEVTRFTSLGNVQVSDYGIEYDENGTDSASVPFDLSSASRYTATRTYTVKHDGNVCQTVATTEMEPQRDTFLVKAQLTAYLGDENIFDRVWEKTFNRNS